MEQKKHILQNTSIVCLGALICCALWGSAFPCIKIGYELFAISSNAVASQILFAGIRFTLAGILVIFIGSIIGKEWLLPKKESLPKIFKLSLLQTVLQYLFFYVGLANTTGVKASIIGGVNVFIAILVASLLFKQEKLTRAKMVGCMVGFAGVVLVNLGGGSLDMSLSLLGEGAIFLSTVAYAFSSVYLKRYSKTDNPVLLSGWQFVVGGMIMMAAGLVMGGQLTQFLAAGIGVLLYLAFVSAIAYSLWGMLLKYNPVSKVAVFGFMNPVFGVILSAIFLGESEQASGIKSIIALILVSIGIYITAKEKKE